MGTPIIEREWLVFFDPLQDGLLAEIGIVRAGRGVVLVDARAGDSTRAGRWERGLVLL